MAQVLGNVAVGRQTGPGEAHALDGPEAEDAAPVGAVGEHGRQGVQHAAEAAQLGQGKGQVGLVRLGEMGVDPLQLPALRQRPPHRHRVSRPRPEAVHPGVHLQVRLRVGGQRLHLGECADGQPHAEVSERPDLLRRGRREQQQRLAEVESGERFGLLRRRHRQPPHVGVRRRQPTHEFHAVPVGVGLDGQQQPGAAAPREGAQVVVKGSGGNVGDGAGQHGKEDNPTLTVGAEVQAGPVRRAIRIT